MLSLFAYGLTFGQAQAVSELTLEPSSSCATPKAPNLATQELKQLDINRSYPSEHLLELQRNYYLERREFF